MTNVFVQVIVALKNANITRLIQIASECGPCFMPSHHHSGGMSRQGLSKAMVLVFFAGHRADCLMRIKVLHHLSSTCIESRYSTHERVDDRLSCISVNLDCTRLAVKTGSGIEVFYVRNTCATIGLLSQQHMISSQCYSLIVQSARSGGGNLSSIVLLEPGPASTGPDRTPY